MRVSYSRIGTFNQCPYKFKLKYIDELETYPDMENPRNALYLGTALHRGIETDENTAICEYLCNYPVSNEQQYIEAYKLQDMISKCKKMLPEGEHEVKIEEKDEFLGFIDLLVPVEEPEYEHYIHHCKDVWVLPTTDTLDGEAMEVDVPEERKKEVDHSKKYDWYDIYDFKYSNNTDNYLESGQLHVYKYYFEKMHPDKKIRNLYYLFVPKLFLKREKGESIEKYYLRMSVELAEMHPEVEQIIYDEEKVNYFLKRKKLCEKTRVFDKSPGYLCKWCEYQEYCEEGDETMLLPKNERIKGKGFEKKKMWFYGRPFSGKTYLANQFPNLLLLSTDGNYKNLPGGEPPHIDIGDRTEYDNKIPIDISGWETFKDVIIELEKKDNDFETICVDLLEDLYELCRTYMYNKLGITHESDDPFRAWDKVRGEFMTTMKKFMSLDYKNIILLSHEDTSRDFSMKGGDKITTIKPNLQEKAAAKITGMVDITCRIVNDENKRVISFKNNENVFGGGRLGDEFAKLGEDEIPCSYKNLMDVYNQCVNTQEDSKETEPQEEETQKVDTNINEDKKVDEKSNLEQESPKRKRRRVE